MANSFINALLPDTSDHMLFAVPKKGRLYDQCLGLLSSIGIEFNCKPHHNIALVTNMPIALTKNDVAELMCLGFGKCKLQVQAPLGHQGVVSAEDLVGKRIVTSFINLTKQRFAQLEGVSDPEKICTQVRFVSGSVEAACGLGLADGIGDLVESGDTMRAAGLHAIDTILDTESVPITNQNPGFPKLAAIIQKRVEGILTARQYVFVSVQY
ncbi:ATP phosphoribosyltransferase (ATP-PRTase) (ATP-PRT) [Coemansia furcata]|uniref:ATP phosphoribosyltransferase (ATP-PRTase) (ATP-PRT) n=1 Tax=Coemansia furcata TaxID=417177 RepID=A0ACC1LME7_9FUNG|nr:ATP phosphoribosyltransferase (ATP-PRTase) (ATP-PRT) [Coemansia furcata]